MIDCFNPFIPGDVGNACTYDYPVLYHEVPDVTIKRLLDEGDLSLTPNVIEAARHLERQGVRAITSDCGYMLHFQDVVADAVKIPVMLSSLLQLPFIASTLGRQQSIGIICANSVRLSEDMLEKAFPYRNRQLFVAGMEGKAGFRGGILEENGIIDSEAVEQELVEVGRDLLRDNPAIGAILLECSNLPPYAQALQRAVGLPVFDFITMIDQMRGACFRRSFSGSY
ncbi:aspartate/glutamate racemase family protein [Mesorhizobium sp. M0751]